MPFKNQRHPNTEGHDQNTQLVLCSNLQCKHIFTVPQQQEIANVHYYLSDSQTLLWGPQVLLEYSSSAPGKIKFISILGLKLYYFLKVFSSKLKLDLKLVDTANYFIYIKSCLDASAESSWTFFFSK